MSKLQLKGRVINGVGGVYTVYCGNKQYKCFARGKLKRQGEIYIGDIVEFSYDKEGVIEKVLPRKSKLVRPYVSNMDILLIIIADTPKPDMLLLDKLVIGADEQGVHTIIAVNKCDKIDAVHLADSIADEYKNIADVIKISANTGYGIDELKSKIQGKYVCLAGQSAVGKSSLINALLGQEVSQTGELSAKSARGRHTTRHIHIYEFNDGTEIADTCGFSMLEMPIINPAQLKSYYHDFCEYARDCKYINCNHALEEDCGVKRAVDNNKLSKSRYERYLQLYNENLKRWNNRYE